MGIMLWAQSLPPTCCQEYISFLTQMQKTCTRQYDKQCILVFSIFFLLKCHKQLT